MAQIEAAAREMPCLAILRPPAPVMPAPSPAPAPVMSPLKSSTPNPPGSPELLASPHASPVRAASDHSSGEDIDVTRGPSPPPSPPVTSSSKAKTKGSTKGKSKKAKTDEDDDVDVSFVSGGEESSVDSSQPSMSQVKLQKVRKSRGKEKHEFTIAQEEDLAEWYRDHPIFYDKRHRDYKDNTKKSALDAEKAKEMDLPASYISTWKTSMRTRYSRLTKSGPSGSGARSKELTPRENWIISAFGFLKEHIKRSAGMELGSMSTKKIRSQADDDSTTESEFLEETSQLLEDQSVHISSSRPPSVTFPGKKRKRKEEDLPHGFSQVVTVLKDIVAGGKSGKQQEDEAAHPMQRTYETDADEAWKSACTSLFLTGLKLPEHQRNDIVLGALAKMNEIQAAAHQRRLQQQQQGFIPWQPHQQQPVLVTAAEGPSRFTRPPTPAPGPSQQPQQQRQQQQSQEMSQNTFHTLFHQPTQQFLYLSPAKMTPSSWNTPAPSYGSSQQPMPVMPSGSLDFGDMSQSQQDFSSSASPFSGKGFSPAPSSSSHHQSPKK